MKKYTFSCILFFAILFYSCSDSIINENVVSSDKGQLSLRLSKESMPQNIVLVTAALSRNGFNTITTQMNITSDSTATTQISNLQAGVWLLKVEAKDADDVVKYSGESSIEVFGGINIDVNLSLTPVQNSIGGINITVSWGESLIWIDYVSNPLLSSSGASWDMYGIYNRSMLVEGDTIKMWYCGMGNSSSTHIGYAYSTNGVQWIRNSSPVMYPTPNSWDNLAVTSAGAIMKENGQYRLFSGGWTHSSSNFHIGLATSIDGKNWTKYPNIVLAGTSGWEYKVVPQAVLKINNQYYLYYSGVNYLMTPSYRIGLAISNDGITFTRYNNNPIMEQSLPWELNGIYSPHIYQEDNVFKMIYSNGAATAFGYAYSTDGINWTKKQQPIFTKENTQSGWANASIAYPTIIKYNNSFRIYYSGNKNNSNYYSLGFCYKSTLP